MKINILNNNDKFKSDFDEKESEIVSFDEKISGKEIASFNFDTNFERSTYISTEGIKSSDRLILISRIHKNKFLSSTGLMKNLNGDSHIIDGEASESKRCYNLRISTVRKISELKSIHPDINICVSTIVDLAVDYYHSCIMED